MPRLNHDPEKNDLGILEELIESVRKDTLSDDQWLSARRNLAEKLQAKLQENFIMSMIHQYKTMKYRWAYNTAFVVAVLAFVVGLFPWENNTNNAFATAIEHISKANTLSYTTKIQMKNQQTKTIDVLYKEPSLVRLTMEDGLIAILDLSQKKGLSIMESKKEYAGIDLSSFPSEKLQINLINEMRRMPHHSVVWQISPAGKNLENHETEAHQLKEFHVKDQGLSKTFKVDGDGNPVHIEGEFANAPGSHVLITNFKVNPVIDDSLFNLNPPENYRESKEDGKALLELIHFTLTPPALSAKKITHEEAVH